MLPLAKGLSHRMTCQSLQLGHSTNPEFPAKLLQRQRPVALHYPSNPCSGLSAQYPSPKLVQTRSRVAGFDRLSCHQAKFQVVRPAQFVPMSHRNRGQIQRLLALWRPLEHPEAKVRD